MKKLTMMLLVVSLSIAQLGVFAQEQVVNQAQELFDNTTQSLRIIKPYERDEEIEAQKIKNAQFATEPLSEGELFDILSRIQCDDLRVTQDTITDAPTLTELQVISLANNMNMIGNKGLLRQFNPNTIATDVALAKMLTLPIDNITLLNQRKELVNVLMGDDLLVQQLKNCFDKVASIQEASLRFYTDHDFVQNKIVSQHFFCKKLGMLNGMPWAQSVKRGNLDSLQSFLFLVPVSTGASMSITSNVVGNCSRHQEMWYDGNKVRCLGNVIKGSIKDSYGSFVNTLKSVKTTVVEFNNHKKDIGLAIQNSVKNFREQPTPGQVGTVVGASIALGIGYYVYVHSKCQLYSSFVKRKKCFKFMQEKMIAVATYLDQVRAVREIIMTTPELANNAVAADIAQRIEDAFVNCSPKAQKLIKLLQTNTFKGDASYMSRLGNVLAAYHLMGEVKDELAPLFLLIGELDAYCAVADLYNRYQSDDMPVDCTFVEFVENTDKPYVKAVDFWNPHVDPTKVVTNSITFGGDKEQNVVVTGINRGGKSTIFGAFVTDVLFAQSFGIAFAKEFVMTPFAKIGCYMNTMGDITAGMSTFQAEQHRAQQLCQTIDALQGKGFTLMFMDELFTGTDPLVGSLATCGFAKRLAQFDNAISVFVTHYKEPIKLEEEVPGKITNYSVGAIEKEDGSFIPTYTLNVGASYQNDALQMLGDLVI